MLRPPWCARSGRLVCARLPALGIATLVAALCLGVPATARATPEAGGEAAGGAEGGDDWPWKRFNLSLGGLVTTASSDIGLGESTVGLVIDPEQVFGLERGLVTFSGTVDYRLGRLPRHRISLAYTMFRRSATRTLDREVTLRDVVFDLGVRTDTRFELDFIRLGYDYSVVHDERMDLAVGLGIFAIPVRFTVTSLRSSGETQRVDESLIAPVPALALRGGFAISERWFLYTSLDLSYVAVSNVEVRLTSLWSALEWRFAPPVAVGVGFEAVDLAVAATSETDWPGLDLLGTIAVSHAGAFLYLGLHL